MSKFKVDGSWGENQSEGSVKAPSFSTRENTVIRGFNAPTHEPTRAEKEASDKKEKEHVPPEDYNNKYWIDALRFLSTK